MGFPAEKLEGVYRNHIDEVYRFLEQMHKDHYKIYNLCSERSYDVTKFHQRVVRYAFEDHTPPNIELIQPFCEDVHSWLNADSRNVAAVHCKAGKGRTGTMVCCYLLYSGQKATADEALKFYGTKRTHDEKGVTIPSQRRYVEYFAALVRSGLRYSASKVHIREVLMSPPPALTAHCTLEITVAQAEPSFKTMLGAHEARRGGRAVRVSPQSCTPLCGDVRLDVYAKQKMMMRKERLFHLWFNTFFVTACVGSQPVPSPHDSPNLETFKLTLNKWELDDAHKDKQHKLYSADFKVEIIIQKQPESSKFSGHCSRPSSPPSSTASSCSEPDTEPDAHWDSGERACPCPCPACPCPCACPCPARPGQHTHVHALSCSDAPHAPCATCGVTSHAHCDHVTSPGNHVACANRVTSQAPARRTHKRTFCKTCSAQVIDLYCNTCNKQVTDVNLYTEPCKPNCVQCTQELDEACFQPEGNGTHVYCDDRFHSICQCDSRDSCKCKDSFHNNSDSSLKQPVPYKCCKAVGQQSVSDSKSFKSDVSTASEFCKSDTTNSCDDFKLKPINNVENDSFKSTEFKCSCKSELNPNFPYEMECDCKTVSFKSTASNVSTKSCDSCLNGSCNCIGYKFDRNRPNFSAMDYSYTYNEHIYKETVKNEYFEGRLLDDEKFTEGSLPKVGSDQSMSDEKRSKPRLSLGDMRASWREFSGKFGESRKKKNKHDC
ncbi:unnamed protein product [Colias eurytheme]|nr:unnamed protein product [Colias eurytheme]